MLATKNMKLWLPFETNYNDFSGNGHDATNTSVTLADGRLGKCAYFNGNATSAQLSLASSASLSMDNITISFWIKFKNNNVTNFIMSNRTAQNNGISIGQSAGILFFDFGGGMYRFTTTYTLPSDTWTFVTFTRSPSLRQLYVNGVFNCSTTAAGTNDAVSNPFWIGGNQATNAYFNGYLDDFQIYNEVLSANDIKRLYLNLSPIS